MITRNHIFFYRVAAFVIEIAPLIIEVSFQWQIIYAFMYLPLASLGLAVFAKYIDFKLMAALLLQEKKQNLSQKVKSLVHEEKPLNKIAA